jgi:hypothetical protein
MSEEKHGIFGGIKHLVDQAAVAVGAADEVPDQQDRVAEEDRSLAEPPAIPRSQPSVPGMSSSSTQVPTQSNFGNDVEELVRSNFPTLLQSTPSAFQNFLAQKAELMESLRGDVPSDKLESAAMKSALRVAKLTPKDVKDAMRSARSALVVMKQGLDSDLARKRKEQVEDPTQKLQETRNRIEALGQQIIGLQREKSALESGIEPLQREVAEADTNVKYVGSVVETTGVKLDESITAMEEQLTILTGGKK